MKLDRRLQFPRLLINCHAWCSNSVIPCITHLLGLWTCPESEQQISFFLTCFQISCFLFFLMITHFHCPAERGDKLFLFCSRSQFLIKNQCTNYSVCVSQYIPQNTPKRSFFDRFVSFSPSFGRYGMYTSRFPLKLLYSSVSKLFIL